MATIEDHYPELTELHLEFMRALANDPEPPFNSAYLWYQGLQFERDGRQPSATSRGHEALCYLDVTEQKKKVPGQTFPPGKSPKEVCSTLISRHAADWQGPYQINFRYDRNAQGVWSGFYSVETSAKHRDIVAGRTEYDNAIAAALKNNWDDDTQARRLVLGSLGPEPKLVVRRNKGPDYLEPDPALRQAWDSLAEYLKGHGVRYIYVVDYTLTKPTSRLREGDNLKLIYSV
jgi:hypothetical protein